MEKEGKRVMQCETQSTNSGFEDEMGHYLIGECEQPLETGKARKQTSPKAFRKECRVADTFFLAP